MAGSDGRTAFLALICLGLVMGEGQSSEYSKQVWTREDGLPSNQVDALLQSRDGYLWIATDNGLVRFDGVTFTVFNRLNTPAMSSDEVTALAEDSQGRLWVGTARGLLRRRGDFELFLRKDGLTSDHITCLAIQGDHLWVATTNGLSLFEGNRFREIASGRQWFNGRGVRELCVDSRGVLWVTSIEGVSRWNPTGRQFDLILREKIDGHNWADALISEGRSGLWFRRARHLYTRFNGESWVNFATCDEVEDTTTFFFIDSRGDWWIGTDHNGVTRIRGRNALKFGTAEGLSDDLALCMTEDRDGNLWFGTEHGGLNCWRPARFKVIASAEGLTNDNVWALTPSKRGGVWIGTDGGVSLWNSGNLITNYSVDDGLPINRVRALCEDRQGTLWVGTARGLISIDERGLTHHRFPEAQPINKMRTIYEDASGRLWVGWEHGLAHFRNGDWVHFNPSNGLAGEDVRAILRDNQDRLWVGTSEGGITILEDGKLTSPAEFRPLGNRAVTVIHQDETGDIWIGTEDGLWLVREGGLSSIQKSHGLPDDEINCLLEDGFGNFWISCGEGIYRTAKQQLRAVAEGATNRVRCVLYGESDGLLRSETNGGRNYPTAVRMASGELWFATTRGVAIIDAAREQAAGPGPPVVIEEVRANHRVCYRDGAALAGSTYQPVNVSGGSGELQLKAGSGRFLEFHYTANSPAAGSRVRFKYRVEGQSDWIDAGVRRSAYFSNLGPGRHRFQVAACDQRGVWNETGATLAFRIAPFLHETLAFKAGCGLTVAGVLVGAVGWRVRKLKEAQRIKAQAAHEAELARIARELHDDLGSSIAYHRGLIEQLEKTEHAAIVSEPVAKLAASTQYLAQRAREIMWTSNPRNDTVEHFVDYVSQYACEFLRTKGIGCRLDVPLELPARLIPGATRHHALMIVKEAIHNVVKHADASEVRLQVIAGEGKLILIISDNGQGCPPGSPVNGNGIYNMTQRAKENGLDLRFKSDPGQGTTIQLTIA